MSNPPIILLSLVFFPFYWNICCLPVIINILLSACRHACFLTRFVRWR